MLTTNAAGRLLAILLMLRCRIPAGARMPDMLSSCLCLCACLVGNAIVQTGAALASDVSIDELVSRYRLTLGLPAEIPVCTDAQFLRRVYLDITGFPPTAAQIQQFHDNPAADRRQRLIDQLLSTERYAWKWGRWLAIQTGADREELTYAAGEMGVTPEQIFYAWVDWMHVRLAQDVPYDQIVRDCLLATSRDDKSTLDFRDWMSELRGLAKQEFQAGGLYAGKPTNDLFWRRSSMIYDPVARGEDVASRFLGIQLECARCHDHPAEAWTMDDHQAFNAVFDRVRYSEFTLTHQGKLWAIGVSCGTAAALFFGLIRSIRRRWRVQAEVGLRRLLAAGLGAVCYLLLSYLHLASAFAAGTPGSPALALLARAEAMAGGGDGVPWLVGVLIAAIVLSGAGIALAAAVCGRWLSLPVRAAIRTRLAFFWLGFVTLLSMDGVWILRQAGPVGERVVVAHAAHRGVLRLAGVGGAGTQPREVFVDQGPLTSTVSPRLLDGTPVAVHPGIDPRQALLDWLCGEQVARLSGHLINQLWTEYFGGPLSTEATDGDPQLQQLQKELRNALDKSFRSQRMSMRHLQRAILSSRLYQQAAAEQQLTSRIPAWLTGFPARRLSAEQMVTCVDQVTGRQGLGPVRIMPPDGTPYQVGSEFPWDAGIGASLMRLLRGNGSDRALRTEGAMLLLVDQDLQAQISDPGGWLSTVLAAGVADAEIVQQAFVRAYARPAGEQEVETLLAQRDPALTRETFLAEILWALVNSAEFQFLY